VREAQGKTTEQNTSLSEAMAHEEEEELGMKEKTERKTLLKRAH
jgi:hypothetical protein